MASVAKTPLCIQDNNSFTRKDHANQLLYHNKSLTLFKLLTHLRETVTDLHETAHLHMIISNLHKIIAHLHKTITKVTPLARNVFFAQENSFT